MTKVHTIQVPLPFPVKWINCYYVQDSSPALIDTGILGDEALNAIRSAIAATGGVLEDLGRIIITHGHLDHMGSAGAIAQISRAEVFIHSWDKAKTTIVDPEHVSETRRKYSLFFAEAGMPEDMADALIDVVITRLQDLCGPISRVTEIHGGEVFRFDNLELEVIHTPGHTPGSVCLLDARHGRLISGDGLIEEMSFNPATDARQWADGRPYHSLTAYRQSWDSLYGLDVRKVFPGHGRPYPDLRKKIERLMEFHERRRGEILRILGRHGAVRGSQSGMTRFDTARRLFPAMQGLEVYHRIAAVRVHLEVLEAEGLVSSTPGDSGLVYSLCRG